MIKILHISRTDENHPTFKNFIESLSRYEHIVVSTKEPVSPSFKLEYIKKKLRGIKILINRGPDIVIIREYFGWPFGILITLIGKVFGVKTVAIPDIPHYALPQLKFSLKNIIKILRYPLYVFHAHILDAIVCFTEYEVETLLKLHSGRKRIWTIPWGCDLDFEDTPKNRRNYILTLAAWSERKNLHQILKVFGKVSEKINVELYVAGKFRDGEYRKMIESIAKNLEKVRFLGFVSDDVKCDLMKYAKIFYLPSKMETLGRVYIEAMASGTPIVAMKNSAVQYVVKDGVTGFLRNDEEGQKEAILKLLTDKKLYKEMQKNCLKEAEKYKWENIAKEWERLIEELISDRK